MNRPINFHTDFFENGTAFSGVTIDSPVTKADLGRWLHPTADPHVLTFGPDQTGAVAVLGYDDPLLVYWSDHRIVKPEQTAERFPEFVTFQSGVSNVR